jgi:hypothetical protein
MTEVCVIPTRIGRERLSPIGHKKRPKTPQVIEVKRKITYPDTAQGTSAPISAAVTPSSVCGIDRG